VTNENTIVSTAYLSQLAKVAKKAEKVNAFSSKKARPRAHPPVIFKNQNNSNL